MSLPEGSIPSNVEDVAVAPGEYLLQRVAFPSTVVDVAFVGCDKVRERERERERQRERERRERERRERAHVNESANQRT